MQQSPPWALAYLRFPILVLGLFALILIGASFATQDFRFDASSDTLVVEGDADLAAYNKMVQTFGGDAFLFLTFEPNDKRPFTTESLAHLSNLVADLYEIDGVVRIFSVLDAPLLKSPPISLEDALQGLPTLTSPTTQLDLAQKELTNSPFFKELLVTADGSATALKIDLTVVQHNAIDPQTVQAKLISDVRAVRDNYAKFGTLHLGGVPMIASDMVTYVKRDLSNFGGAVLALMLVTLGVFFRQIRWIVLPLCTAAFSVVLTVGLLGMLGWQATVISSNFISLLGITTISLTIHLIVQYREFLLVRPDIDKEELVFFTMREKFIPCLYTALTTIAAFGSLVASGILPVEYFGWMMCIGILVSFATTYTFFPAALILLPPVKPRKLGESNHFVRGMGEFVRWRPKLVTLIGACVAAIAAYGISLVSLDNRFVDYFDSETEIYQSMRYIDTNLGGTIPFDVILTFDAHGSETSDADPDTDSESFEGEEFADEDFDDEDIFSNEFGDEFADEFTDEFIYEFDTNSSQASTSSTSAERYWFTRTKLDELAKMHRFLEEQPQVGKVLSLTSLEDFAADFTGGRKLTSPEIVAILGALPSDLYGQVIEPYANPMSGEMRLSGRIIEGGPSFDREAFRQQILAFSKGEVTFANDTRVTGMMVLFNSMLAQLFDSQVNTLAYILAIVFIMFLFLLRSIKHALLGMIPNSLAAATVIGAMGYTGVPLDMMTTTIAAVCIGIGVDDTIHYLHRFREEYAKWGDPRIAVSFSHESIGRALFYTTVTVMVGFSVLCLSSFVPTVMFGLWTAVAMLLALIANLTLLPALLVLTHASPSPTPTLR